MPRGWFEGNWDGIADCEPYENDKGREFFLTGHINLNRSGACAAMFAKHQSEEAKKFRVDNRGNIVSRRNLPPNKRREGYPLSVSQWREQGGNNPNIKNNNRDKDTPPPHDPTKSKHNMTTRAKKNYHNSQEGSIQSTSAELTPQDNNITQNSTNTLSQPTQSASADGTGGDNDNDPPPLTRQNKERQDKTPRETTSRFSVRPIGASDTQGKGNKYRRGGGNFRKRHPRKGCKGSISIQ